MKLEKSDLNTMYDSIEEYPFTIFQSEQAMNRLNRKCQRCGRSGDAHHSHCYINITDRISDDIDILKQTLTEGLKSIENITSVLDNEFTGPISAAQVREIEMFISYLQSEILKEYRIKSWAQLLAVAVPCHEEEVAKLMYKEGFEAGIKHAQEQVNDNG